MARVTVTPVIGAPRNDRLRSLTGCHALMERSVTRPFNGRDEIGPAIADALHEIAVSMQGRRSGVCSIDDMCYVVKFSLE